jgi:hypothetical protein
MIGKPCRLTHGAVSSRPRFVQRFVRVIAGKVGSLAKNLASRICSAHARLLSEVLTSGPRSAAGLRPNMQRRCFGLPAGALPVPIPIKHAVFVTVAIWLIGSCDVVEGQSSIVTATTGPMLQGPACPALDECANDAVCAECLSLLLPSVTKDEANQYGGSSQISAQEQFFMSVVGPTCFRNSTMVPFLSAAADEIFNLACNSMGPNGPQFPVADSCLSAEFNCALNPICRQCLQGMYTSANKGGALDSPSCAALGGNGLQNVSACKAFPQCTFAKQQCENDVTQNCGNCLSLMRDGDVTNAVQQCSYSSMDVSAVLLDSVASICTLYTDLRCNYFTARCDQDVTCRNCLADIGGAQTAHNVAEAFLNSPSCLSAVGSGMFSSSTQSSASQQLHNVFWGCPPSIFDTCVSYTVLCILDEGYACAVCLAGSASQQNDPSCELLLATNDVNNACTPCSNSVYENNRIVLATSVVGGMSILPCIVVILVIIAYGKDIMYLRSRIIIGLMMSNIVYSIANAIPVAMLQTSANNCGRTSLSYITIRFGRAWWFAGKYALIFFELFILGVAAWALKCGLGTLGVHREALSHFICVMVGVGVFIGFFVRSGQIESDGYNAATQAEVQSNAFSYLGGNDDLDGDEPQIAASQKYSTARNEYDTLVQQMLQVWIAFLGMSILLWFYLRWTFARLTKSWLLTLSEAEEQWNRELWASDQQGERQTKRRFLELTKESYDELFRPLEPFVAVFIAFGIPACVMATNYCHGRSGVSTDGSLTTGTVRDEISVGKCDVVCELILSFRSIATVAVFFYSREHRSEIYHFRTMLRRLQARIKGWFQSSNSRHSSGVRFRGPFLEEVHLIPRADDDDAAQIGKADDTDTTGATVPYTLMDDAEAEGTVSRDTGL